MLRQLDVKTGASSFFALDRDASTVRSGDGPDDGKTDARAAFGPRTRLVHAKEPVEDMGNGRGRNSDTRVRHVKKGRAVAGAGANHHPAAGWGVFDRVVEQGHDDLLESPAVPVDHHFAGGFAMDGDALVL